jgi:hypothetical protein
MAKRERPRSRLQRQQRRAARAARGAGGAALAVPDLDDDLFDLEGDGPCDDPTCPACQPGATQTPQVVTPATSMPAGGLNARRAMERVHARIGRVMRRHDFGTLEEANAFLETHLGPGGLDADAPPESDLERAQEVVYDAWERPGRRNRRRRVTLAGEALALSPDCADAYVLLAEETARSPAAARPLYEQGVAAGERALGEAYFREQVGEFWGLL